MQNSHHWHCVAAGRDKISLFRFDMALTHFTSHLIADTGISMGDEGKGRLIPEIIAELQATTGLADPVAIVMKVNGGANSGHTAGGLKLNLLPAGVVSSGVATLALGAGVVADPRKVWWELRPLDRRGYEVERRLVIDERCMVSDITHRLLDLAWEDYRVTRLKQEPRGSTGRGITPAYMDEVGQFQIFYADFCGSRDDYAQRMLARMERACNVIRHVCGVTAEKWYSFFDTLTQAEQRANQASIQDGVFPAEEFNFGRFASDEPFRLNADAVIDEWWAAGSALADNIRDLREYVLAALHQKRYVIGEFGQAFWLDKRHGFSPNVTASHTYTPEFFQSAGIPVQPVHTVGCCKAYDTKVGTHLFLTQMEEGHPLGERLKRLEFGTSTGRQRMVGWFDAVEKGDALRYGGFDDLVINKLDALTLDSPDECTLKVCTHYEDPSGRVVHHVPRDAALRRSLRPVYAELPGWTEDIRGVRSFSQLPEAARRYIAFCFRALLDVAGRIRLETLADHAADHPLPNLRYIGVGPDPDQIIKDIPATPQLLSILADGGK